LVARVGLRGLRGRRFGQIGLLRGGVGDSAGYTARGRVTGQAFAKLLAAQRVAFGVDTFFADVAAG